MTKTVNGATGTEVLLQNEQASLSVDLFGGAITDFHLKVNQVNPLSFRFTPEQMPENNRGGAPFQGHFLCLGRWGEPSDGEIKAGVPNHGQFANILWAQEEKDELQLNMSATANLEGLQVRRTITLDSVNAVIAVEESVSNINSIGRLYNMVQHPTLSAPFLGQNTQVDCNATTGFNQHFSDRPNTYALNWPKGFCEDHETIDLRVPDKAYNGVFSFIVDRTCKLGWVTAFSPGANTLIGYIWRREDYPWIHLWQHFEEEGIRYRGIEFGTAGIHKPFPEILASHTQVFREKTLAYIDAGEIISKRYISFLAAVPEGFAGVDTMEVRDGNIHIKSRQQGQELCIETNFKDFL